MKVSSPKKRKAFTLIELMLAVVVLTILLTTVVMILDQTQRTWRTAKSRISQFRDARLAFELITRTLSQATLNTYYDYYWASQNPNNLPPTTATPPDAYQRMSELRFRTGYTSVLLNPLKAGSADNYPTHSIFFQAPLGFSEQYKNLNNLLCARGYFIEFGDDNNDRPDFLKTVSTMPLRHRYRLMEFRPPAERNRIYTDDVQKNLDNDIKQRAWFVDAEDKLDDVRPVADNIIALILSPRASNSSDAGVKPYDIAPKYYYDSADTRNDTPAYEKPTIDPLTRKLKQGTQHLLPPLVNLTMVAIDERSAENLNPAGTSAVPADIKNALANKFVDASKYDKDITDLEAALQAGRINYRIFSSTIPIRSSKWDGNIN